MARKSEAQIKFSADTKGLRDELSQANSSLKLLSNELKLNATQLKGNAGDIDLLTARQDILQRELEESANKVALTEQSLLNAKEMLGENSKEYEKLANDVLKAKNQEAAIKNELDEVTRKLNAQEETLEDTGEAAVTAGDGFTVAKGVISDFISSAVQGAINKLGEFVGYLTGLPEATRELRQDMSTLSTSFDDVGMSTDTAQETWKELYAVFGEDDRAVETANHIARMSENQKDLNNWVTISTGVYGKFQDSLDPAALAEAAVETKNCGTVTGALADALNWSEEAAKMFAQYMGGDVVTAEDAFNVALSKCTTEQERQQLITDTLTQLYGGAAESYRETAGAQMEAKEATADNILAEAELAEVLEPLTTKWQGLKTELLEGAVPAFESAIDCISEANQWVKEHETALTVAAVVVGGITIAIGAYAAAEGLKTLAVQAGRAAEGKATVAMGLHAAATAVSTAATTAFGTAVAFLTSPITLVVAGITLLTAAGVLLYKNWDTVSKKAVELKENVLGGISKLCEGGVKKFEQLKEGAGKIVDGVKEKFSNGIEKIKGFFDFDFKWPKIPLPHFSVTPAGWGVGDLLKGSIPKLGIKWYAKGMIFTKPTVINTPQGLKGFGEAGHEAALPIVTLKEYMRDVLDEWASGQVMGFDFDYDKLGNSVAAAMSKTDQSIVFNKREFGRIVREVV